jgi:hypothetical protein
MNRTMLSFVDKLERAKADAVARQREPWLTRLERVRGKIDFFDGLERISTQCLLDILEIPQAGRRAGTYRRLSKAMAMLGWNPVRVRDLTRGGYLEQVRGYCRDPRRQRPSALPDGHSLPAGINADTKKKPNTEESSDGLGATRRPQ